MISVVRDHYGDFGPTLAREYLAERHDIHLACETLRLLLIDARQAMEGREARRPRPYLPREGEWTGSLELPGWLCCS